MICPAYLSAGDLVAVIAPSGKVLPGTLDAGIEWLKNWGLHVQTGKYLYDHWGSLAGTDDMRLSDLQAALDDTEVRAIFMARGGYGLSRLMDRIDWTAFLRAPKWIVGFSDVTALHLRLTAMGIASLHAPILAQWRMPAYSATVSSIQAILFGHQQEWAIPLSYSPFQREGHSDGIVWGGNLSLINDMIGTSGMTPPPGGLLFIEEVHEYPYHIDRMCTHLLRSGILAQIGGLVAGHFTQIRQNPANPFPLGIHALLHERLTAFDIPLGMGLPVGHCPPNHPMVCGADGSLHVRGRKSHLYFRIPN